MFELNFDNKVVLLTGASRGIGRQIFEDLDALGAKVIGISSKDYDFSSNRSVDTLIKRISDYQKIDICINNAGINFSKNIDQFEIDQYNKLMDINLKVPFQICRKVSKIMKKNSYGKIVNISSIAATRVREGRSVYSASKHGLVGMTKTIAIELAPYNILVNSVSPGFTMTEMTQNMLPKNEMRNLEKQVPMGRFASPSDISKAVLFLCSELNTYITGHDLIVDGGFTYSVTV